MTTSTHPLISRPGGHSTKNAHRAGAPNTQPSGENPMVGTMTTADTSTVTAIRDRLAAAGTSSFLTVDRAGRCVRINLWTLARLVNTLVHEQVAQWQSEARRQRRAADRLDHEVRAALGAPEVGGSCVEWAAQIRDERDDYAKECEQRAFEILDVIGERDQAEAERDTALARVADLLARAGETR